MSSVDVGTAFVRVVPDTTGFRALLQTQVNAAVAGVVATVPVVTAAAAGNVGANTVAASAVAATNLAQVEKASKGAATGLAAASTQSKVLQGSIIGLSRISPVAVFGLGLYGSAAIGAGLAVKGAISSAADFEEQLNTFAAVTGASADELEQIKRVATDLGADLSLPAVSAGDAAVAMTELAKAGLTVNDTIAASRGVLQLASAANISVGESAQIAATQLNAFQLAGDQATRVAELLADASIAAQGEIGDFAAGFQQTAAVANQVGLSIEDTTALLTQLGQAGLRGADGGTSLRTALLRLVPTTKEAAEFQKALGIQLDETKSIGDQIVPVIEQYRTQLALLTPVQQQQVLTQIFGQDAIRAASILFSQEEGALRSLTAQFERTNAVQDLSDAKAKGLKGAFRGLQSQGETLGLKLGEFTTGPLTALVEGLSEAVKFTNNAVTAFGNLNTAINGINVPGTGNELGDFFGKISDAAGSALFLLPAASNAAVDKIKEARATVREEIARQNRLDQLAQGQRPFGIAPVVSPADFGIDEDVTAAAKAAIQPALTAAQKRRRAAVEAAAKADEEAKKIGLEIPVRLQQAVIDAQLENNLQAEKIANQAIVDFLDKRLDGINEGTQKFLVVSGQLRDAQEQRNLVISEIEANANRSTAEQKEKRDKAAAEAERLAREAAEDERKRSAAQELLRQTILGIQSQSFRNALASADLTDTPDDNKKVLFAEQRRLEALRDAAKRVARNSSLSRQALADARLKVLELNGQILGIKSQIKNLGKDGSGGDGFSLQDLFQEAVNQFNTFGSNIAGRNGVLSPQDERAAFGQTAVKNAGEALAAASLTQQERQTALLESINSKLIANPQGGIPVTGNRGRIGGLTAIEEADRLAANGVLN